MKIPPNLGGAQGAAKTAKPPAAQQSPQFGLAQLQQGQKQSGNSSLNKPQQYQPQQAQQPQQKDSGGDLMKQLIALMGKATGSSDGKLAQQAQKIEQQLGAGGGGGGGGAFSALA